MPPLPRLSLALLASLALGSLRCAASDPETPQNASGLNSPASAGNGPAAGGTGGAAGAGGQAGPAGSSAGGAAGGAQAGSAGASDALEVFPAMFVAEYQPLDPIEEGEEIPLTLPPQGGHVLLVGAQIRNLRTDTIELRTKIRDPETGALVAEEGRTVVARPVEGQPGLFQPDIRTNSQINHVPVCPDYDDKDITDRTYQIEVSVRELYVEPQRTAKAVRSVVPTCKLAPDQAFCECECKANYVLGKCTEPKG